MPLAWAAREGDDGILSAPGPVRIDVPAEQRGFPAVACRRRPGETKRES